MREKIAPILREAFTMNRRPFPWAKAVGAGLAMALPIIFGLLLGELQYGLLAGMGGFTFLYSFPIPYAQLAKRLAIVAVAIALCSLLGSLSAPYPLAVSILLTLIAMVALFLFGTFSIGGPNAIFFVLIFAITADMPAVPLSEALLRAGLTLAGGGLSWIIAMSGALFGLHKPEISVVKRLYHQLSKFVASVGTHNFSDEKSAMMNLLTEAEEVLSAAAFGRYRPPLLLRLTHLTLNANKMALIIIERYSTQQTPLPDTFQKPLNLIATELHPKRKNSLSERMIPLLAELPKSPLTAQMEQLDQIISAPLETLPPVGPPQERRAFTLRILEALNPSSLVLQTTLRFGLITFMAALLSTHVDLFVRAYWIPVSAVAVMSGASLIATYHRAIQRMLGTFIGIFIAAALLALHPNPWVLALLIFTFTAIIELCIVRNYGLAVIFITPNALLIAETITGGTESFLTARLIDITLGSLIGFIGVITSSKRTASNAIPTALQETLRRQGALLFQLYNRAHLNERSLSRALLRMTQSSNNLAMLVRAAMSEIPLKQQLLEYYWPIIYSTERLTFLLTRAIDHPLPQLTYAERAQLLALFELLALHAYEEIPLELSKPIPKKLSQSAIGRELLTLQHAFQQKKIER